MDEIKITLRVKHEPDEGPNHAELQILRDYIKGWCAEFCLEREELTVKKLVDRKTEKLHEVMEKHE